MTTYTVSHLISPEWVLSDFARTSNNMPGIPFTLQNRINTAAFLAATEVSLLHEADFEERERASRRNLRVLGVNGCVNGNIGMNDVICQECYLAVLYTSCDA